MPKLRKLKVLDLFSGIGGFSLGLERAGFETVAFCEIEPYPQAVLRKHWPNIPIYEDVKTLTAERLGSDGISVDVICGGFPCQDISVAGKQVGIEGERSGLWSEFARLIGEIRPYYAIVENVTALLSGDRGGWFGRVLGDLAEIGYDAEWHCIPASAVGAPHFRDRIWILAYPNRDGLQERTNDQSHGAEAPSGKQERRQDNGSITPNVVCTDTQCGKRSLGRQVGRIGRIIQSVSRNRNWEITSEPILARGTDGISYRLDRLKAVGNAVVPQIPEIIGKAILEAEEEINV